MKKNEYQDFKVNIKLKLSLLWTSVMFCYVYGDYFQLYVPGKVEGLIKLLYVFQNRIQRPKILLVQ